MNTISGSVVLTKAILTTEQYGERVFAVCGSSHAVKIERALRETLRLPEDVR